MGIIFPDELENVPDDDRYPGEGRDGTSQVSHLFSSLIHENDSALSHP